MKCLFIELYPSSLSKSSIIHYYRIKLSQFWMQISLIGRKLYAIPFKNHYEIHIRDVC